MIYYKSIVKDPIQVLPRKWHIPTSTGILCWVV